MGADVCQGVPPAHARKWRRQQLTRAGDQVRRKRPTRRLDELIGVRLSANVAFVRNDPEPT